MTGQTSVPLAGFLRAAIGFFLSTTAPVAFAADEVRVYLSTANGQCRTLWYDANEAIDIDITPGTHSGCGSDNITMIRINAEDPNSHVLSDIGPITITGYTWPRLRVLIAGFHDTTGVETTTFPLSSATEMPAGARHWQGIIVDGADTREITHLSAAIAGNLDGPSGSKVEVGKVVRLQVTTTGTPQSGGNISIPIEAWGSDFGSDGTPIGHIVASNSISGDIVCKHDASAGVNNVSITSIEVAPNANAAGISGRILAPYGSIDQIKSTGPITIDSSLEEPGILAGGDVGLIFTGEWNHTGSGLPTAAYDIDAFIQVGNVQADVGYEPARLENLRTAGDLKKAVFTRYLRAPGVYTDGQTWGIWVGGTIEQPITVAENVNIAVIRGATFAPNANVTIGNLLKGTVEAAKQDGEDWIYGQLRTVSVGRGLDGTRVGEGMNGVNVGAADPEGVIRAATIEAVDVRRMFLEEKPDAPRILAGSITKLKIDEMYEGEVTTLDVPQGYVVMQDVQIGNTYSLHTSGGEPIRPTVWCDSFENFVVYGSHAGRFRFPSIPNNRAVIIGGLMQNSPPETPVPGVINIDEAQGLAGQVIINGVGAASPDPEAYCSGPVIIENGATDISLSVAASTDNIDTMPVYTRTSGTIGGGAAGLAPFYMYEVDCDPPHDDMTTVIRTHEFDRTGPNPPPARPIKVLFYGPVRTDLTSGSPVDLWFVRYVNGTYMETLISPTRYAVTVKRGLDSGFSRDVSILGNGSWKFPAGWYEVRRSAAAPTALYCDLILPDPPNSPAPVRDFTYGFYLTQLSSTGTGEPDDPDCPCPADFDHNGGVDGGDVEAFFNAWSAGEPEGDVNCDGGVDGPDVEWFFVNWENGGCG
ncbi:MAG: hypothetical protein JNK25_00410 [Phycisphaerae bacterium]|nr:hypothetical protein [Phycisphaerae bacterium]